MRQEELCEGICSVSQLSKIENGKVQPKDEHVQAIAKRLGMSVKQLQVTEARRDQIEQEMKFAIQASKSNHERQAITLIEKVIEEARNFGYEDLCAEAMYQQIHFYDNLGEWPQVIRLSQEMLTSGMGLEPGLSLDLWGELGTAHYYSGNLNEAFRCYARQEGLIDGISTDHPQALRIYIGYVANQYFMRRYREVLFYCEKAMPLAIASQRHIYRWRLSNIIALSLNRLREDPQRRYELLESSLQEAEQNGNIAEASQYANNLGALYYWDQDYDNAQRYQELCIRYYDLVTDAFIDTYRREPYYQLASGFIQKGQYDQAKQIVEKLRELCKGRIDSYMYNARIPQLEAEIARVDGRWQEQVQSLKQALEIYERHHVYFEAQETAIRLAEVLEGRGELSEALQMYRRAVSYQQKLEETRLPMTI